MAEMPSRAEIEAALDKHGTEPDEALAVLIPVAEAWLAALDGPTVTVAPRVPFPGMWMSLDQEYPPGTYVLVKKEET